MSPRTQYILKQMPQMGTASVSALLKEMGIWVQTQEQVRYHPFLERI